MFTIVLSNKLILNSIGKKNKMNVEHLIEFSIVHKLSNFLGVFQLYVATCTRICMYPLTMRV